MKQIIKNAFSVLYIFKSFPRPMLLIFSCKHGTESISPNNPFSQYLFFSFLSCMTVIRNNKYGWVGESKQKKIHLKIMRPLT